MSQQKNLRKHIRFENFLLFDHGYFGFILVNSGTIPVPFWLFLVQFRLIPVSFRFIPAHSGSFWCHSGSFRLIPVPFRFIPDHSSAILVHSGPFRFIPVSFRYHSGIIPYHSTSFCLILPHSIPFRRLVTPTDNTLQ